MAKSAIIGDDGPCGSLLCCASDHNAHVVEDLRADVAKSEEGGIIGMKMDVMEMRRIELNRSNNPQSDLLLSARKWHLKRGRMRGSHAWKKWGRRRTHIFHSSKSGGG